MVQADSPYPRLIEGQLAKALEPVRVDWLGPAGSETCLGMR